jgi:transcriptional regulator with XRE-family HTH domain
LLAEITTLSTMDFAHRLATLRKERGISQPEMAKRIGVHVTQVRRYEAGTSQPTLEIIRQMSKTLGVSADVLIFSEEDRTPDAALRDQFAAIATLDDDEKHVIRTVIDGVLLKHEARKWAAS